MGEPADLQVASAKRPTQSGDGGGLGGAVSSGLRMLGAGFERAVAALKPPVGTKPKTGQPAIPDAVDRLHLATLAQLLKTVNPQTAASYGPLLDAWAARLAQPGSAGELFASLAAIMKLANPMTAAAYGPALDAWAASASAPVGRLAARFALFVQIVKTIQPTTAAAYGPLLDAWLSGWSSAPKAPTAG